MRETPPLPSAIKRRNHNIRKTYDRPRRKDAVGLVTMLRDEAKRARSAAWPDSARRYERWARWVKAVLDNGGGGE